MLQQRVKMSTLTSPTLKKCSQRLFRDRNPVGEMKSVTGFHVRDITNNRERGVAVDVRRVGVLVRHVGSGSISIRADSSWLSDFFFFSILPIILFVYNFIFVHRCVCVC